MKPIVTIEMPAGVWETVMIALRAAIATMPSAPPCGPEGIVAAYVIQETLRGSCILWDEDGGVVAVPAGSRIVYPDDLTRTDLTEEVATTVADFMSHGHWSLPNWTAEDLTAASEAFRAALAGEQLEWDGHRVRSAAPLGSP